MTSKGTLAPASILAESWSIAAEGYDEIFVPRFKPWTDNALALLGSTEFKLPQGDVLVPTCGPGHELPLVAELLKNRNVRGTDLAPGMIDVAQKRCEGNRCEGCACAVEDAMAPTGEYAALFSVFGLQQLPDHAQAIQGLDAVSESGRRRGCYILADGPRRGKAGPVGALGTAAQAALGDGARRGVQGWEDALPSAIEAAGGEVLFAHPLKYRIECRALRRNQLQRATRHRRDVGTVIASARWRGTYWFICAQHRACSRRPDQSVRRHD